MRRARQAIRWILVASLAGCGSTTTEPDLADQLVGDWSWLDSVGGIAGLTLTPETEGYAQSLTFYAAREVELFRDGVSQARTGFSRYVGDDGGSDFIEYGEGLFGFPTAGVVLIPGDTLLLIDPCCDGFLRRWVR